MPLDRNHITVPGTDRVFHRYKILAVLLIPLGMALMAVSSVNVALPSIGAGLNASSTDLQWVLSGYALAFGLPLIAAGRAGDVLGRSTVFSIGVVIFSIASLVCGLAPSAPFLNVARLFQGLGAALVNPATTGLIQQFFTGIGRARAFAMVGVTVSASVAVGPVISGGIIALLGPALGWRAAFIINFPLGIIGLILALSWLPFDTERVRRAERLAGHGHKTRIDLDPVGALILAAAVLSVMLPFMTSGLPAIWLLLLVGAALVWVWVRWERRYQSHGHQPMVDLSLFRIRSFSLGSAIGGTYFVGAASVFVIIALFVQNGPQGTAWETGLLGLPSAAGTALGSLAAGKWTLTYGRRMIIAGQALFIAGLVIASVLVFTVAQTNPGHWWLALPLGFVGCGAGVITACNQTLAMEQIPAEQGGTAGGIKATAERIGTAIGNAMITGVLFTVMASAGWAMGYLAANTVIIIAIGVSITFAIIDARGARAEESALKSKRPLSTYPSLPDLPPS